MAAIVRDALIQDFEEVAAIAVEAYREYSHALTPDNWHTMQTNLSNVAAIAKQGKVMVAELSRELVGSVGYCPPGHSDSLFFQPEWASIRMLAVLPQYRGQGISQQLTLECIHRAQQDRGEVIALYSSELMMNARRMYERLGFQQDIELPRRLGIRYWRYVLKLQARSPAK
jgi:ribosomal protein S18 acetylase RimI-like enzyme